MHPRDKAKEKHWENVFYCKRSKSKSLSFLKPSCTCWPVLVMPRWHKAGCGLYSSNGKGRKNIVWGKGGGVGQGRLLNEFHTLHF